MSQVSESSIQQLQPQRRHVSPWLLVLGAGLLFFVGLTVVVGVAAMVQDSATTTRTIIAETPMPDGTILVLEQVTFGKDHRFTVEHEPRHFTFFPRVYQRQIAHESTQDETIMLWFSRKHATTGEPLDFDWWSHSIAFDEHDCEIEDDEAGRNAVHDHGGSGVSGSRPFSPVDAGRRYDHIIAHSGFRPFRHAGNMFTLQVFDTAGRKVAEFEVPDPNPRLGSIPTWTAEPLPATKTDGDLTVTLTELKSELRDYERNGQTKQRLSIRPIFETTDATQPVEEAWQTTDTQLLDAAGNRGNLWDCRLCPKEAAWKLQVKVLRNDSAAFDPSEMWNVKHLVIPEKPIGQFVGASKSVGGVSLELHAIGGAGDVTYTEPTTSHGSGSSSSGGSIGSGAERSHYRIESKSRDGVVRTTIKAAVPHLAVRVTGVTDDHRIQLRATDDQGREVKTEGPRRTHRSDLHFWFLEVPAGAKSIDTTLIVQQPRVFEFYVKPPDVDKLEKPESAG